MPYDENGVWYEESAGENPPTDENPGDAFGEPVGTAPDPGTGEENTGPAQLVLPDLSLSDKQTAVTGTANAGAEQIGALDTTAAPAYVDPALDPTQFINAGSGYSNAESTVFGQLEKNLSSDSAYMKRAATSAREQASDLGMLSSSAGIGAAHAAAIDRAMPAAQQDADTAGKFQMSQQNAENTIGQTSAEGIITGAIKQQEADIASNQAKFNAQVNTIAKGVDASTQLALTDYSKKWDMVIGDANMRLDAALKTKMIADDMDAKTASEVRQSAGQLIVNYQISAEELLKDPEFLMLGPEAIKSTLNNLLATTSAGIQFMADSSGINMDDYLDDFIENAEFDVDINYEPAGD